MKTTPTLKCSALENPTVIADTPGTIDFTLTSSDYYEMPEGTSTRGDTVIRDIDPGN